MLAEESSSTTPLQVILSETPADTSGVPGISLPPLQDAEVEHLRLYLAVSSRAKGIGKAAVHRSTLYYDAFGAFATKDIVTLANSAPCDAIGKISGDINVPSSTGGTPPIYNPKRAAAVWTTTYTASGCVQLILSSEDQHGIWVNDPLDATRENCVLVAWAPQRLATPNCVYILPSKPIAKDEEYLVAHGSPIRSLGASVSPIRLLDCLLYFRVLRAAYATFILGCTRATEHWEVRLVC